MRCVHPLLVYCHYTDPMCPPPPRVQRGLPGNGPPLVDHCWNVPLLAAISTFLITLPSAYMGILFVFFVEDYNISRERASWPENVLTMCIHLSGTSSWLHRFSVGAYFREKQRNAYHAAKIVLTVS